MRKLYIISLLILFTIAINSINNKAVAQFNFKVIPCTTQADVIALIDTVFLAGVNPTSIRNISFSGDPTSVGYFYNAYFAGFSKPVGIIMTNGKSDDADKSNVCNSAQNSSTNNNGVDGDSDLNSLCGSNSFDGCIIEFEFKPTSDTVSFNYVFASEEYHDYVFAGVNDAFGFFLSGAGISGNYSDDSENIAIIPNTSTPVSINTVNYGAGGVTCTGRPSGCTNCSYFKDNSQTGDPAFGVFVYDGLTTSLTAKSPTVQCEWYKIKLKIGDGGDGIYDSGVLLEAGSFDPGNVVESTAYTHPTIDSILYESCNNHDAILYFGIGTPRNDPFMVPFQVEGTATRNVDYLLFDSGHEDTIYIAPGALYDSIIIRPFLDFDIEGIEDIQVIFSPVMCPPPLSGPAYDTAVVLLSDVPEFPDTNRVYNVFCEDTIPIGFNDLLQGIPPYEYEWYNSSWPVSIGSGSNLDISMSGLDSDFWYCVITDTCGYQSVDTAFIIVPDLDTDAGLDKSLCNQPTVTLEGLSIGAQNYNWLSNPLDPTIVGQGNDTITVGPPQTTEYILVATDNCTNSDQDTAYVTLDGAVANASDDGSICLTDSISLSCNLGSNNETYIWTSIPADPGLSTQNTSQIIKVSPTITTIYYVEVTDDCDYQDTDEVEVVVNPLPVAFAGNNNEICNGEDYTLLATGGVSYQWGSIPSDPSLFVNQQDTLANPTITPNSEIIYKYYVEVSNEFGCTTTDTMELTVNHVPDIQLSPDNETICFGDTITITAIGDNADNYIWSSDPPDPSLSGVNQVMTAIPDVTTTYSLVATVGGINCPAQPEYTITVIPQLFAAFEISDDKTETCENEPIAIFYSGNASINADYEWNFGSDAIIDEGSNQGPYSVYWSSEGIRTITLTLSENDCPSDTMSMDIEVIANPAADFIADPESGCAELEVAFTNQSTKLDEATYIWNIEGAIITDTNTTHLFTTPGLFEVTLITTNRDLCADALTKNNYITVHEIPEADFDADPPETILEESLINFTNNSNSNDILTYQWYFGDNDSSTVENPEHKYNSEGVFLVTLIATSSFGCTQETSKNVTIHPDFAVFPPNAFTPNGDGENDTFEVKGTGINSYSLRVFSRWGELIFESSDLLDQWDGTYEGNAVPTGTYIYKITYQSMVNIDYSLNGTVTVIR